MPNKEHIEKLKQGVREWNDWRKIYPTERPDLNGVDFWKDDFKSILIIPLGKKSFFRRNKPGSVRLGLIDLRGADLCEAKFSKLNLNGADIREADFSEANLRKTYLMNAELCRSDFYGANLSEAKLNGAHLWKANLRKADLSKADLSGTNFWRAELRRSNLNKANLQRADLRGAKHLTIEQLRDVKTLFEAQLDLELEKQVNEKCRYLLEKPKDEE